jgi:hypothetical protein
VVLKVIAALAIVVAGFAAAVVVARPALDPDLVVGYWQREVTDDPGVGPDLIRIDRDGSDYRIVGVVAAPDAAFKTLSDEFVETLDVDGGGISLKTLGGGEPWVEVRIEPATDGKTLNVAVIPWEEDRSGIPEAQWLFVRPTDDEATLAERLDRQIDDALATPAPAPAP